MSDREAAFVGNIPTFYDQGLGPVFFAGFADDIARCVAVSPPIRVLETAAGTGIVTRRLRDLLPREAQLTAIARLPIRRDVLSGQGPGANREAYAFWREMADTCSAFGTRTATTRSVG